MSLLFLKMYLLQLSSTLMQDKKSFLKYKYGYNPNQDKAIGHVVVLSIFSILNTVFYPPKFGGSYIAFI